MNVSQRRRRRWVVAPIGSRRAMEGGCTEDPSPPNQPVCSGRHPPWNSHHPAHPTTEGRPRPWVAVLCLATLAAIRVVSCLSSVLRKHACYQPTSRCIISRSTGTRGNISFTPPLGDELVGLMADWSKLTSSVVCVASRFHTET